MAKKPNPLLAGLSEFDRKGAPSPVAASVRAQTEVAPTDRKGNLPPSRVGLVQLAAYFPDDVRAQLKILAAEQRRDMQELIAEALNLVFAKYGKAEIAPRKNG